MELKMTERDKILLCILVIMVVVFGAVMFPNWGIMASIQAITNNNNAVSAQKSENVSRLEEMEAKGIDTNYADNLAGANRMIQQDILQAKYDAIKNSQQCMSSVSTSVVQDWLKPLAYNNYEYGTDSDQMWSGITGEEVRNGYRPGSVSLEAVSFESSNYTCTLKYTAAVADYIIEYENMSEQPTGFAELLTAYNHLVERGSIYVKSGLDSYRQENGKAVWTIELVIPKDSAIADYRRELCECHQCGAPYSKLEYDTETSYMDDVTGEHNKMYCPQCGAELNGITLE